MNRPCCNLSRWGFWMRWSQFGPGWNLLLPITPKLFSERFGYCKPVAKLFGFRLFRLEAYR